MSTRPFLALATAFSASRCSCSRMRMALASTMVSPTSETPPRMAVMTFFQILIENSLGTSLNVDVVFERFHRTDHVLGQGEDFLDDHADGGSRAQRAEHAVDLGAVADPLDAHGGQREQVAAAQHQAVEDCWILDPAHFNQGRVHQD